MLYNFRLHNIHHYVCIFENFMTSHPQAQMHASFCTLLVQAFTVQQTA